MPGTGKFDVSHDEERMSETHTQIRDLGLAVRNASEQIEAVLDEIKKGRLGDACRYFKELSDAYAVLDDQRKKVYNQVELLSRNIIPEMMEEEDATTITLEFEDGTKYRFTKNRRTSCSIVDKDGAYKWLRETGNEAIIVETVNASTLSSFAKHYVEDEGKDLPADFFKQSSLIYTSVTKG